MVNNHWLFSCSFQSRASHGVNLEEGVRYFTTTIGKLANALTYRMWAWMLSQLNQVIPIVWAVHDLIILIFIILTCGRECQILVGDRQAQLHFKKEISNNNHRGPIYELIYHCIVFLLGKVPEKVWSLPNWILLDKLSPNFCVGSLSDHINAQACHFRFNNW